MKNQILLDSFYYRKSHVRSEEAIFIGKLMRGDPSPMVAPPSSVDTDVVLVTPSQSVSNELAMISPIQLGPSLLNV